MACGLRVRGPGGASSTSTSAEKGKERGLFCVVWSCRTDGIKTSLLAISTGVSHTFRPVVFLLQLKMWFTSCVATSYLRQVIPLKLQIPYCVSYCCRSHSSKSIAGDSIQCSVALVGYVQFVASFVFLLLSFLEVYLVACSLCSTKYGTGADGSF